ncbi:hypothetical protein [Sphingomonas paeninsulae]|uniref:hypothetical protein n=1 Tax=Sphingomonas paeninsulae TaxID=2319844 RepID=UPI001EEFF881|nr:hypothetical protein [Sphingomonas paeninsulae]
MVQRLLKIGGKGGDAAEPGERVSDQRDVELRNAGWPLGEKTDSAERVCIGAFRSAWVNCALLLQERHWANSRRDEWAYSGYMLMPGR